MLTLSRNRHANGGFGDVDVSNADLSVSDKKRLYEEPTGFVGDNGEFFYRRENSGEGGVRWLLGFYGMQTFDVYVIGS